EVRLRRGGASERRGALAPARREIHGQRLRSEMIGDTVYFVFLAGGIKRDDAKIKAFSQAAGLSLYDAKIMLGAPGPRKVGAFAKEEEAGALVINLRQAGLPAVVVDKNRFSRLPKIFKALKAVEASDGLTFTIE